MVAAEGAVVLMEAPMVVACIAANVLVAVAVADAVAEATAVSESEFVADAVAVPVNG